MRWYIVTDRLHRSLRRGNGGISHHPDETMTPEDAVLAARAFTGFVKHFKVN
jgi:acetylornithine deacetylase/succinyl-diaminopimelate desuccinylase-like protein